MKNSGDTYSPSEASESNDGSNSPPQTRSNVSAREQLRTLLAPIDSEQNISTLADKREALALKHKEENLALEQIILHVGAKIQYVRAKTTAYIRALGPTGEHQDRGNNVRYDVETTILSSAQPIVDSTSTKAQINNFISSSASAKDTYFDPQYNPMALEKDFMSQIKTNKSPVDQPFRFIYRDLSCQDPRLDGTE